MKEYKTLIFLIVICLTLGLAPFSPEPHIWQKLKWVFTGANGMKFIDWFDLFLHGMPWILLIGYLVTNQMKKGKK